ncbi:Alpha/Beta hydrolase protein [Schizothecium vesticola]|uniref:Alpha/Beta hydrolase protein n=1 Tax=Schizothecium vesticola TaxID=314040 RepID=A0AA40KCZ2_9PEZI|nr:Alpha/Beta hydrolase protein [Schizothecium vesticola]
MASEAQPLLFHKAPHGASSSTRSRNAKGRSLARWVSGFALFAVTHTITHYFLGLYLDHPHRRELTYSGEKISWKPCGTVSDHDLECSTISVPMDHFNTSNNANGQSFSIPLLRMRGKNATRNILLNPGGPGGSGAEFIYRRGAQLSHIIGEGFHLLGFDPRGVNESRPIASCYPDSDARRALSPIQAKKIIEDSGSLWAWANNYAHACSDTMGEYASHINTPQTAADMNTILDAIGQEDMYYWGFSYGTLLGQTYATLFPERSKRVAIDGVVNQFDWYEQPLDQEELVDTEKVFAGFVDECVKAGPDKCALASLAETKSQLSERLISSIAKLRDEPLPVYINNTVYGALDQWSVWYDGVFSALYRPALWSKLASNLASFLGGNATDAFLAYSWGPEKWNESSDPLYFVLANDGAAGPKHWPRDRTSMVSLLQPFFNQSMFGDGALDLYFIKATWSIPRKHSYVPRHGVKTAHPLLILSTTYDPVCPLLSARSANHEFEGSRIVEVKGYGHCSVAVPSMCAARRIREFFYEGKLPSENVQCEVDGEPYFEKPDESGRVAVLAHFDDPEEQKIHLAQVELARDLWLRPW